MKRGLSFLLAIFCLTPIFSMAENNHVLRILLIGTDDQGWFTVSEEESASRADAIFVVSLHVGSGDVRVLSVERDYLVTLPDGIGATKLNTTTFFGGPQLCLDAVNDLFGTDIPHYLQVSTENITDILDALGGVDVEVYEEELELVNAVPVIDPKVVAGINHLDGLNAQYFMRVRDWYIDPIESNIARNDRQMRVLSALLEQAKTMSTEKALELVSGIVPLLQTNISLYHLLILAQSALHAKVAEISYSRSPGGPYQTKRMNMHQVIVADDMQEEIRNVHEFLMYP